MHQLQGLPNLHRQQRQDNEHFLQVKAVCKDLRFLDPSGSIVGLRAKGEARNDILSDGTLTTNFSDDGILTWDLKGDTLTFYEDGNVDDIVYLKIINKNKFIMRYGKTDDEGIAFDDDGIAFIRK